jgi:hypothetical protein
MKLTSAVGESLPFLDAVGMLKVRGSDGRQSQDIHYRGVHAQLESWDGADYKL